MRLRTIVLTTLLLLASVHIAAAQQRTPAPYTIEPQTHQALMNFLSDVPAKYANPLINVLVDLEAKAAAKALEGKKDDVQK